MFNYFDPVPAISNLPWNQRDALIAAANERASRAQIRSWKFWVAMACGIGVLCALTYFLWTVVPCFVPELAILFLGFSAELFFHVMSTRGVREALQAELRERNLLPRACLSCGYDLKGCGARCPECGVQLLSGETPANGPPDTNSAK